MIEKKDGQQNAIVEINIDALDKSDLQEYFDSGILDDEILSYSKDKNETAFIEERQGRLTAVFQMLDADYNIYNIGDVPKTVPVLMVLNDKQWLILTDNQTTKLFSHIKDKIDSTESPKHILFQALTQITKQYFNVMVGIAKKRDALIKDLQKRPRKENIAQLATLQSGSVYLFMAAQQNNDMLKDFKNLSAYEEADSSEKEAYTDAVIESRQLYHMTSLHERLLNELSSSYNNVLSNRLNDNVTNLTILSLGFDIITAVSSFYGMNVKLPFAKIHIVWLIITILSAAVALIAMIAMRYYVNRP